MQWLDGIGYSFVTIVTIVTIVTFVTIVQESSPEPSVQMGQ